MQVGNLAISLYRKRKEAEARPKSMSLTVDPLAGIVRRINFR